MGYTTAAICKLYMGITTATDDTLIGTLIVRAQAMVDSYTHRTFEASADSTKFFNSRFDVYGRTLYFSDGLEAATITTITNHHPHLCLYLLWPPELPVIVECPSLHHPHT